MANITLKGNEIHTQGELPKVGSKAPNFKLTNQALSELSLNDFEGKKVVLNIFPSIDTATCAASVRHFNTAMASKPNTVVLCISKDLPFAQKRFCAAEGIENVVTLSDFKNQDFTNAYQLLITDGPLAGLHSRVVMVLDETGTVTYTEQVADIVNEPNYEAALAVI